MSMQSFGFSRDLSVLFARFFGFYILIMLTALVTKRRDFKAFAEGFMENHVLDQPAPLYSIITINFIFAMCLLYQVFQTKFETPFCYSFRLCEHSPHDGDLRGKPRFSP